MMKMYKNDRDCYNAVSSVISSVLQRKYIQLSYGECDENDYEIAEKFAEEILEELYEKLEV